MDQVEKRVSSWRRPFKGVILLAAALMLFGWLWNTPEGVLGKADAIGYAVCHRIDLRSFHIGDRQLPLCARCTGMYLGAVVALVFQAAIARRRSGSPPWPVIAVMALLVAAFGLDGLNSYLNLFPGAPTVYQPQNWLRLLTGTGMGLTIALAIYPAFNQTVWADVDNRRAVPGFKTLLALVGLALLVDALVLIENPVLLFVLALVSAGGVLGLLVMIYTMVVVMFFKLDNRFQSLSQMLLPLTGGFMMALAQVIVLDVIRYWLTGTWDGFHIG